METVDIDYRGKHQTVTIPDSYVIINNGSFEEFDLAWDPIELVFVKPNKNLYLVEDCYLVIRPVEPKRFELVIASYLKKEAYKAPNEIATMMKEVAHYYESRRIS